MILGLSAKARMGKDTVADLLVKHYGFTKYSFARPIKEVTCALFNWGGDEAEGKYKETEIPVIFSIESMLKAQEVANKWGLDKFGFSVLYMLRELYRHAFKDHIVISHKFGQSWSAIVSPRKSFQVVGTEYGREQLDTDIWLKTAPSGKIVIADVRFENEANYIRHNGLLVHIKRDAAVEAMANSAHASEAGIAFDWDFDMELDNNGTLHDLAENVEQLYHMYLVEMENR